MVAAAKASAASNRNPSAQQQIEESCKVGALSTNGPVASKMVVTLRSVLLVRRTVCVYLYSD